MYQGNWRGPAFIPPGLEQYRSTDARGGTAAHPDVAAISVHMDPTCPAKGNTSSGVKMRTR
jgi:hypothetical protein